MRKVTEGLRAAIPAAILSGLPSTVYALATKRDPVEATAAAGSILLPAEQRRSRLLLAAVPVHLGLSLAWAIALAALLPRRHPVVEGAAAGLAIAAVDLGYVGRRFPRIRNLEPLPQIADHIAFGLLVSRSLAAQESRKTSTVPR